MQGDRSIIGKFCRRDSISNNGSFTPPLFRVITTDCLSKTTLPIQAAHTKGKMTFLYTGKGALAIKLATFPPRWKVLLHKNAHSFQVRSNSTSVLTGLKSKTEDKVALPPLSGLPATVLFRSLFISAISSKPYLLRPSLSVLSLLCKPHKSILFDVDRNVVLHWIMKSVFYKQFCAGETHDEVKSTIRHFKDMGFQGAIMTYAKETVFDHRTKAQQGLGITKNAEQDVSGNTFCPHIEAWRKGTVETVELLGKDDYLAVK